MADYFFLLDGDYFERSARPTLADSWQRRSFAPCRELCAGLVEGARNYAAKYHVADAEPLVSRVAAGCPFERTTWRFLVAEVLLYAAVEIPEIQTCPDTLCCLLAPEHYRRNITERAQLAPIQQAHVGSRDLTFGTAIYRPDQSGYNNAADVILLADYFRGIRLETWTVSQLADLRELPAEDREEELAFARDWFPVLADLFERARERNLVIVHEWIY